MCAPDADRPELQKAAHSLSSSVLRRKADVANRRDRM